MSRGARTHTSVSTMEEARAVVTAFDVGCTPFRMNMTTARFACCLDWASQRRTALTALSP
jgi:hypothetical protein